MMLSEQLTFEMICWGISHNFRFQIANIKYQICYVEQWSNGVMEQIQPIQLIQLSFVGWKLVY